MSLARYLSKLGALLNSSGQVPAAGLAPDAVTNGAIAANSIALSKLARVGTAGQVLTSGGTGADPSYQALPTSVTSVDGASGVVTLANLSAFTKSLATSGYQKLPGGLIIQWGYNGGGATTTSNTFPIAFPTACRSVTTTINTTSNVNINNRVDSMSTTGFNSWVYGNHAYNWMAIGY